MLPYKLISNWKSFFRLLHIVRKKRKWTKLLFLLGWAVGRLPLKLSHFPQSLGTWSKFQILFEVLLEIYIFSNILARPKFQKGFWNILSLRENTITRKPYGIVGMSETNTLLMEKVVLSIQLISPGLILSWYLNDQAH